MAKEWRCPDHQGPVGLFQELARNKTGRWWVRIECGVCNAVLLVTKYGITLVKRSPNRKEAEAA